MKAASQGLDFTSRIRQEFIDGSAIHPDLFAATVQIVEDTGRWEPYDALGWKVSRFWMSRRPHDFGAIAMLVQEDGSYWQGKPQNPRTGSKGKQQRYEAVKGNGNRPFLPAIPQAIREAIAARYGCTVPAAGELFWPWLQQHPEIPIVITEGAKKSESLLSLGYVAIALYGVNAGYRKLDSGAREILPELLPFVTGERRVMLAFDQDEQAKTRRRVNVAQWRFGSMLSAAGAVVSVASWKGCNGQCKGVDDLIVSQGPDAWHEASTAAVPFHHWQLQQRLLKTLSYPTATRVQAADLSTLELQDVPEQGIIAVASAKGTGKTKLTAQLTAGNASVLSATHRIALGRNLTERLGLHWRTDLDKAPDGRFIAGDGYTLRMGFCVDALLAINPDHFRGCDLVIDEVVQVVRHLLTSSTCARDGRRPVLLARFRALIQAARRVICADADLDNATLHYLQELRGDGRRVFLLRNDYQPKPYPVQFIQSSDRAAVTGDLLTHCKRLERGRVLLAMTDSKNSSKTIGRTIEQQCPGLRVLVINSETSGGETEREFIQTPDAVLQRHDFDVILCSPSVATGVSIEAQGIVEAVYGIFTGVSSTDADMSQALARVRENVPRVVWCAQRGSNYAKASRATNTLELKSHLQQRSTVAAQMTRSSLREDFTGTVERYDWQADPHLNLYAHISAAQNYAMQNLREALLVRLKHEGNLITMQARNGDTRYREMLTQARQELRTLDAEALVSADRLNPVEARALERVEVLTPEQQRAIARYRFCEFYCIDAEALTVDDVLDDKDGRRRGELLNLEAQLYGELATDKTAKSLEQQAKWNQGLCPWDINGAVMRQKLRDVLGLADFFDIDKTWTAADLEPYADRIREHAPVIRAVLNQTISDKMSDVQCVHQLLSQLGIKIAWHWQGNSRKNRIRLYSLDLERWEFLNAVLARRQARRVSRAEVGSPLPVMSQNHRGDPIREEAEPPINKDSRVGWRGQQWRVVGLNGFIAKLVDPEDWVSVEFDAPISELRLTA